MLQQQIKQRKMKLKHYFRLKKYMFIMSLLIINAGLIFVLIYFNDHWAQYIVIGIILTQVFFLTAQVILITMFYLFKKISKLGKPPVVVNLAQKTMAMIIPCYNQDQVELMRTITSYIRQQKIQPVKKILMIVVDGKIKNRNKNKSSRTPSQPIQYQTAKTITSQGVVAKSNAPLTHVSQQNQQITTNDILKNIFQSSIKNSVFFHKAYVCWKAKWIGAEVYDGVYQDMPYIVIVKDQNSTKRDSLALAYKFLYHLSGQETLNLLQYNQNFADYFVKFCHKHGIRKFDYMMTTDADSQPSLNSAYDMIYEVERKPHIFGSTGQVQVRFSDSKCNPLEWLQFEEYIQGQSVARFQQKLTSEKIHCLPGSLNLIRICKQTCSQEVLSKYRFVSNTRSLSKYIKNSASEDRHHIMILFELYEYAKTTMTYAAIVRTSVPVTMSHFLSQRKRWNLGTVTHNLWMTFLIPNIPLWERLSCLMIILQFVLLPTFMYCYGRFIYVLVQFGKQHNYQLKAYFIVLLVLSGIRIVYMLGVGIFVPGLPCKHRIFYLILFFPFIFIMNPLRAIICFLYNLWHLDDFNWIKGEKILDVEKLNAKAIAKDIIDGSAKNINDPVDLSPASSQK